MTHAALLATALVAVLHLGFAVLESLLWTRPTGRRVFAMSAAQAAATRTLALNQGLYNAFVAVGLLWGLARGSVELQLLFLGFVVVAGVVGALTASRAILVVQALPGLLALLLVLAAH